MRHPGHLKTGLLRSYIYGVPCEKCGSAPGKPCKTNSGRPRDPHSMRMNSIDLFQALTHLECCFCLGNDPINFITLCRGKNLHIACEGCWKLFRKESQVQKTRFCPQQPEFASEADAALFTLRRESA